MKRSERLVILTRLLVDRPGEMVSLNSFSELVGGAKSTLSEDLAIIKQVLAEKGLGRLETVTGAGGGVTFVPEMDNAFKKQRLEDLCRELEDPRRLLPGGFIYMADILYSPIWTRDIGRIFADYFRDRDPEYVLTMETKGIPLATMTARSLNCPLVIIRRSHRVTEGSAVSITYITGSKKSIGNMSLPRRALPLNSRVVLIDDFMKAGGTARGMMDLMQEFQARVLGLGVVVATEEPEEKLVSDFYSLVTLSRGEGKEFKLFPSAN